MENKAYYVLLGSQLRQEREAAGLTQDELAKLVGLSRTSVTNIERGRQRLMLDQFESLCSAVGKSSSELLRNLTSMSNPNARARHHDLRSMPKVASFVNEVTNGIGGAK